MKTFQILSPDQQDQLLHTLKTRFEKHMGRHKGLEWSRVSDRISVHPEKLVALLEMEQTGGEPDVVGFDPVTGEFEFYDCAAETPTGRRNLCYDREALEARKEFKPQHSAMDLAAEMGIEILSEEEYRTLQSLGAFDTKTSSWLKTPDSIRKRGGAIFGDRRYDHVFVYHNGAQSYYAVRGFRGKLLL